MHFWFSFVCKMSSVIFFSTLLFGQWKMTFFNDAYKTWSLLRDNNKQRKNIINTIQLRFLSNNKSSSFSSSIDLNIRLEISTLTFSHLQQMYIESFRSLSLSLFLSFSSSFLSFFLSFFLFYSFLLFYSMHTTVTYAYTCACHWVLSSHFYLHILTAHMNYFDFIWQYEFNLEYRSYISLFVLFLWRFRFVCNRFRIDYAFNLTTKHIHGSQIFEKFNTW